MKLTDEQLQVIKALADMVKEAFRKMAEAFAKLIEGVKTTAMWIDEVYFVEQEKIHHVRSSWASSIDSRRKHQVLDRKPRFAVRKVIR